MPSWPFARAEAVRQDVLDAENAKPTLPELVSVKGNQLKRQFSFSFSAEQYEPLS